MELLTSGCRCIDKLLGGGLHLHKIVLLYGEAATGKSNIAMQFALESARRDCKMIYLDSDQSFSTNRMEQMATEPELAERIVLFRPEDFNEQNRILENVENLLSKTFTLLVIDSVTGLYRSAETGSDERFERDRELNRQLAQLYALASRFSVWVLLTGQVHSSPSRQEWLVEPVATRTLRHWSDTILHLTKTPRSSVRDCFIEKRNGLEGSGGHCRFKITDKGVEDV